MTCGSPPKEVAAMSAVAVSYGTESGWASRRGSCAPSSSPDAATSAHTATCRVRKALLMDLPAGRVRWRGWVNLANGEHGWQPGPTPAFIILRYPDSKPDTHALPC